jgi:hypothetical protein
MKKQEIEKKKIRWFPLVPRKKSNTRDKKRSLRDKKIPGCCYSVTTLKLTTPAYIMSTIHLSAMMHITHETTVNIQNKMVNVNRNSTLRSLTMQK